MNEQLATVGIQQTFDYEGAGCRCHVSATDTWAVYIIVDRLHHDTVDPYTSFKSATTDALAVSGVGDEASRSGTPSDGTSSSCAPVAAQC
jgi:hypothetical protein